MSGTTVAPTSTSEASSSDSALQVTKMEIAYSCEQMSLLLHIVMLVSFLTLLRRAQNAAKKKAKKTGTRPRELNHRTVYMSGLVLVLGLLLNVGILIENCLVADCKAAWIHWNVHFWMIGHRASLLAVYLDRLQGIFRNSQFAYPQWYIKTLGCCIAMWCVSSWAIYQVFYSAEEVKVGFWTGANGRTMCSSDWSHPAIVFGSRMPEFILTGVLLLSFFHKLMELHHMVSSTRFSSFRPWVKKRVHAENSSAKSMSGPEIEDSATGEMRKETQKSSDVATATTRGTQHLHVPMTATTTQTLTVDTSVSSLDTILTAATGEMRTDIIVPTRDESKSMDDGITPVLAPVSPMPDMDIDTDTETSTLGPAAMDSNTTTASAMQRVMKVKPKRLRPTVAEMAPVINSLSATSGSSTDTKKEKMKKKKTSSSSGTEEKKKKSSGIFRRAKKSSDVKKRGPSRTTHAYQIVFRRVGVSTIFAIVSTFLVVVGYAIYPPLAGFNALDAALNSFCVMTMFKFCQFLVRPVFGSSCQRCFCLEFIDDTGTCNCRLRE